MVSHDLNEVFRLASQVLCFENGIIQRNRSLDEVFSNKTISGKVQITGQISRIEKNDTIYIVTVITASNQIIKVIAFESDMDNFYIGESVLLYNKAFNL